ncbi:MAG TPA: NAD(P)-binding domain-containing protein [Vicinamibacterales bacterium]|nr:NAD(P)-binding domain-containing protein [Vicinamibacterales bacterium]
MRRIDTIVIGGGQAGLAMSRSLLDRGIDHVVIERGRIGERWRTERWDSLRLLTPNWQSRLPAFRYDGTDPDGYMSMPEVVGFFERYAESFHAPIETNTTVLSVERVRPGFRVETDRGLWMADNVVIATGYSDVPFVPPVARRLSPRIVQVVPTHYRNAAQLPPGGVLVVGASATGIQLADEIRATGRPVTLAVGRHLRLPRRYRGRDILWWLDAMGMFDETIDHVYDPRISSNQPSLQLVGRTSVHALHVRRLAENGVRLLGRLAGAEHERAFFDDDLIATTAASDLKLAELLLRVDAFIEKTSPGTPPAEHFEPTWPTAVHVTDRMLNMRAEKIETVLWATGFKRHYPWLKIAVFDERGEIRQRYGITPVAGLYVLGLHFQRRRKSAFIDGVGDDATFLADRIVKRVAFKALAAG